MFFYHWSEIMDEQPKDDEFILTNTIITENRHLMTTWRCATPPSNT